MSSAILAASMDVPSNPRFENPTAYNPHSPFQPSGNGFVGNPSFSKNELVSYKIKNHREMEMFRMEDYIMLVFYFFLKGRPSKIEPENEEIWFKVINFQVIH